MRQKIQLALRAWGKGSDGLRERAIVVGALLFGVILSIWISGSPQEKPHDQVSEELIVPAGQLIVPLELANANALAALISREAVIDVFQNKKFTPIAENLKIIKLSAGEGPLFGALVPEKLAGQLQDIFSRSQLKGAIRTRGQGPPTFHLAPRQGKTLLEEVSTTDNVSGENI